MFDGGKHGGNIYLVHGTFSGDFRPHGADLRLRPAKLLEVSLLGLTAYSATTALPFREQTTSDSSQILIVAVTGFPLCIIVFAKYLALAQRPLASYKQRPCLFACSTSLSATTVPYPLGSLTIAINRIVLHCCYQG